MRTQLDSYGNVADGKIQIGTFGLFTKVLSVDWERMSREWLALEDLAFEIHWWAGIYSPYNLIEWGRTEKLLRPSEYEVWFNLLQNTCK